MSENSSSRSSNGAACSGVLALGLTILFIGLKLTDNIDWSWIWILCPIWIYVALGAGLIMGVLLAITGRNRRADSHEDMAMTNRLNSNLTDAGLLRLAAATMTHAASARFRSHGWRSTIVFGLHASVVTATRLGRRVSVQVEGVNRGLQNLGQAVEIAARRAGM